MLIKANIEKYGLDDWVSEFEEIYGTVNSTRTPESIWLHAVEHASQLHEDLRIGKYDNALSHLADLFCWLCGFVMKAHHEFGTKKSLLDIVVSKFPRHCFYCKNYKCICDAIIGSAIEDEIEKIKRFEDCLEFATVNRKILYENNNLPKSLKEVEEMLRVIYDHINFRTPLENIMAHLQEEVGEIANCLNGFTDKKLVKKFDVKEHKLKLELEIADVVTWIYALLIKIDYLLASGKIYIVETEGNSKEIDKIRMLKKDRRLGVTLPNILWKNFHAEPDDNTLWCPKCKARECGLQLGD